jgi:hypothetical protein
MSKLQIFDRPMCCSTGVCGAQVDQVLVRFSADLGWLRAQGVEVERYNLSQQPAEFVAQSDVKSALQAEGVACLPLFRVDGNVVFTGKYPSRSMLARWCGVAESAPLPASKASCCGPTGCC